MPVFRSPPESAKACRKAIFAECIEYMSVIENGEKNLTVQQLKRLAQALGMPPDKLEIVFPRLFMGVNPVVL